MPLVDEVLQDLLNKARQAVEQNRSVVEAESKESQLGKVFQILTDGYANDLKEFKRWQLARAHRARGKDVTPPDPDQAAMEKLQKLWLGVGALRKELQAKLQAAEDKGQDGLAKLWDSLLILFAAVLPIQLIQDEKEVKQGENQESPREKAYIQRWSEEDADEDTEEPQLDKPSSFNISAGYLIATSLSRASFDDFCCQKKLWLSQRDKSTVDKYLGESDGFTFADPKARQEFQAKLGAGFKFKDQEQWAEYLKLVDKKFIFKNAVEWEAYKEAVDEGKYEFQNPAEWEAYKRRDVQRQEPARVSRFEEDDEESFSQDSASPVSRLHPQTLTPAELAEGLALEVIRQHSSSAGAGGVAQSQTSRVQITRGHDSKGGSFWQWLALVLASCCAIACVGGVIGGAIALVTHNAFWIIPAAAALYVTIVAAVLLLLIVAGMAWSFSPKKLGSIEPRAELDPQNAASAVRPVTWASYSRLRSQPQAGLSAVPAAARQLVQLR